MNSKQRNLFVMKNIGLAVNVAEAAYRCGWAKHIGTLDDVIQEAIIGLMDTAKRVNLKNPKKTSFLTKSIRYFLLLAAKRGALIHVPASHFGKRTTEKVIKYQEKYGEDAQRACYIASLEEDIVGHPNDYVERKDLINFLWNHVLSKLNKRQLKVISLRFGLNGYNQMTLRDIAKVMGITHEGVRQIELKAKEIIVNILKEKSWN